MSAEHFKTILIADMRTNKDGKPEIATAYTKQPRAIENGQFTEHRHDGWFCGYLYAENVIRIAAQAVRDQPMDGLTGDHPEKRFEVADELDILADKVRLLALDDAFDSVLTDDEWNKTPEEKAADELIKLDQEMGLYD